jgi:hypothetical protein
MISDDAGERAGGGGSCGGGDEERSRLRVRQKKISIELLVATFF